MSADTSGAGGAGDTALNYWLATTAGSSCWYPQPSVLSEPRNSCPTVGFEPQQVSLVEQTLFPPIQPGTAALSRPALQLLSPVQVQVPTTMRSLTETRPQQMVHRLTRLSPQPDAPSIWEQSPSSPITQCAWSGHISDGQNDNLRFSVASDTRHALFVRR